LETINASYNAKFVPYVGAATTVNLGAQNITTTHQATNSFDLVNLQVLTNAVQYVDTANALTYLNKVTSTAQTVNGTVDFLSSLSTGSVYARTGYAITKNSASEHSWSMNRAYAGSLYKDLVFRDTETSVDCLKLSEDGQVVYVGLTCNYATANKIPIFNADKKLVSSGVDSIKITYLDNVSSDIQTQLNGKLNLSGGSMTGTLSMGTNKVTSTASPVNDDDLTRKGYVDSGLALKASLPGNQTFTGTNTFSSSVPIVFSSLTPSRVLQLSASAVVQTSSVTTTELAYLSGVTSAIQIQINGKVPLSGPAQLFNTFEFTSPVPINFSGLTASRVLQLDASKNVQVSSVTTTELGYLSGVTSAIQTQLNGKANTSALANYLLLAGGDITGNLTVAGTVGIGTTSVLGRCNIYFDGSTNFLTLQNATYATGQYVSLRFMVGKNAAANSSSYIRSYLDSNGATDLRFYTDNGGGFAEQMRITDAGYVGIGITNPEVHLNVYGKGRFHNGTYGAPANGINGGDGTRLILGPGLSTACPYGLGVEVGAMWYGVPTVTSHRWYIGTANVMSLNSAGNMILNNRLLNVVGGQGYAVDNNHMSAGSLTIGSVTQNYGGGSYWTTNTAGFMMECLNSTEIAVHDANDRIASFMYYSGNTFTIGRDMGYGKSNVSIGGYLTIANGDTSMCLYGPNSSWGAYLRVGSGTNAVNSNTAQVISTNGNCHIDGGLGKDIYIGFYQNEGGSVGSIYSFASTWFHRGSFCMRGNSYGASDTLYWSGTTNQPNIQMGSNFLSYASTAGSWASDAVAGDMILRTNLATIRFNNTNGGASSLMIDAYKVIVNSTWKFDVGNVNPRPTMGIGNGITTGNVGSTPGWPDRANGMLISTDTSQTQYSPGLYLGFQQGFGYITSLAPSTAWQGLAIYASNTYMYFNGSLTAYTNGGGWVNVSDEREKTDIQDLKTSKSLQRVLTLKPKHYLRKYCDSDNPVSDQIKQQRLIGFIAQEVQQSNPHCLSTWSNQEIKTDEDDGVRMGMSYNDYIVHLVGAVQEQQKQITVLQEQVAALTASLQSRSG
jgi:hypothetical protein